MATVLSHVVTARVGVLMLARPGWDEVQAVALFASVAFLLAMIPAALAGRRPLHMDLRS